jgi:hypothetical protein
VPAIQGYLALGTVRDGLFVEAEGSSGRPFQRFRGHPRVDQVPQIIGLGPDGMTISHGALFDKATGGTALITWPWLPPHQTAPCDFRPLDVSVAWSLYIQLAINGSIGGMRVTCNVGLAEVIGSVNGQAISAATRLSVEDGALVIAGPVKSTPIRKKPEGSFPKHR